MIAIKAVAFAIIIGITAVECGNADKCYTSNGRPLRCLPDFKNIAYLKVISANSSVSAHPASYMNDISYQTWWQSETLHTLKCPVRIILDFGKTFDVTYIKLVFQSPRPHSFAIYKKTSTDKETKWKPFQYYSQSCVSSYGVEPHQTVSRSQQKVALCSEKFSDISPLRNGNVVFSTLYRRPDQFRHDDSPALQVLEHLTYGV